MSFTIDEKSIIIMYADFDLDRDNILASIRESLPHVDDQEIQGLMESVLRKVTAMSKEDFSKIDLSDAIDMVSPEN